MSVESRQKYEELKRQALELDLQIRDVNKFSGKVTYDDAIKQVIRNTKACILDPRPRDQIYEFVHEQTGVPKKMCMRGGYVKMLRFIKEQFNTDIDPEYDIDDYDENEKERYLEIKDKRDALYAEADVYTHLSDGRSCQTLFVKLAEEIYYFDDDTERFKNSGEVSKEIKHSIGLNSSFLCIDEYEEALTFIENNLKIKVDDFYRSNPRYSDDTVIESLCQDITDACNEYLKTGTDKEALSVAEEVIKTPIDVKRRKYIYDKYYQLGTRLKVDKTLEPLVRYIYRLFIQASGKNRFRMQFKRDEI